MIRDAMASDVDGIVDLAERRRAGYELAQPQFWRRAPNAIAMHRPWIAAQVDDADVVALVETGDGSDLAGFVIATVVNAPPVYDPGGPTGLIDDFAVDASAVWASTGRELLAECERRLSARGVVQITVVCGRHDQAKREALAESGLAIASEWYVKPIST